MNANALEKLIELARQIPPNLDSDWRDTNHYELHDNTGREYFWLVFRDIFESVDNWCETEYGKRVGLVMDCVVQLAKALPELEKLNK